MSDITKHKFSDGDIREAYPDDDGIVISVDLFSQRILLTIYDAIAIAKHFNLTEDDLKE